MSSTGWVLEFGRYRIIARLREKQAGGWRVRGKQHSGGGLRIIGGRWRGRKLPVDNVPGLRPTSDRVRETLFNWLAPGIVASRCLDLFAGSGALGLEALSRGAGYCDFVEIDRGAANRLRDALHKLGSEDNAAVHDSSAGGFLQGNPAPYDLVFLDPPFGSDLLEPTMRLLESKGLLTNAALIYLEHPAKESPAVPVSWESWRSKRAGAVSYGLFRRS